jgi:hypothetical protein
MQMSTSEVSRQAATIRSLKTEVDTLQDQIRGFQDRYAILCCVVVSSLMVLFTMALHWSISTHPYLSTTEEHKPWQKSINW